MAKVCIYCEKEKNGHAVLDDAVIRFIRAVKQRLGVAKNNKLVVCDDCLETYRKKRASFERNLAIYTVIAGAVLLIFSLLPVLTTGFSLMSVVLGVLMAGFFLLLLVVNHHCPRLSDDAQVRKAPLEGKKKK